MRESKRAASWLFGIAGVAGLGYAALSWAVARGKTTAWDRKLERELHRRGRASLSVRELAQSSTPLGKWWAYVPASFGASSRLLRARRPRAALTVTGAAFGAALLAPLLDRAMRHRSPPPRRGQPRRQSYPSGHALQTSAVAIATGYVLWREGIGPRWTAAPLGLASVVAGGGRLLLSRHWTTDVLGGYCAGIAFGCACAGLYEVTGQSEGPVIAT